MKTHKVLFFFFLLSPLYPYHPLKLAIDSFFRNDLTKTKQYFPDIKEASLKDEEKKDYYRLLFLIAYLENRNPESNFYFEKLKKLHPQANFPVYLMAIRSLQDRKLEELAGYLNLLIENLSNTPDEPEEFTFLPFACHERDIPFLQDTEKKIPRNSLWRDGITAREKEIVINLHQLLLKKENLGFLKQCLSFRKKQPVTSSLYYLLITLEPQPENYLGYYDFLKTTNKLEALHLLRKFYQDYFFRLPPPDQYLLLFFFRETYDFLQKAQAVLTLQRAMEIYEQNMFQPDTGELIKIFSENYHLREGLLFLQHHTEDNRIPALLQEYDQKFESNELLSYYKEIYRYH